MARSLNSSAHHNCAHCSSLALPNPELTVNYSQTQDWSIHCAVFQQLENDYTIGVPHPVAALDLKEAPIIRMYVAWAIRT